MSCKRLSLGAAIGAVGVVLGDIGTGVICAHQRSLNATGGDWHSPVAVLELLNPDRRVIVLAAQVEL